MSLCDYSELTVDDGVAAMELLAIVCRRFLLRSEEPVYLLRYRLGWNHDDCCQCAESAWSLAGGWGPFHFYQLPVR